MIFNKKGVSEVVANVLIVLLVIVGVGVIWSVVKPTIDKAGDDINADCFTVKVSPVSCTKPVAVTPNCNTYTTLATCPTVGASGFAGCSWDAVLGRCGPNPAITTMGYMAKRDAGAGNFRGFKLVFEDSTGATQVAESIGAVQELATASGDITPNAGFTPAKMNVVAIVGTDADSKTCEAINAPINCV